MAHTTWRATLNGTTILTIMAVLTMVFPVTAASAQDSPQSEITVSAEQAASLGINTVALSAQTQGTGTGFPAKAVIPNNQLRVVSAPLEGTVESVLVSVNQPVKKGDVLAELKSPALVDEQRQFLHAVSQAQVARSALTRDEELLKEGIIAKSRYQATKSAASQAEADLEEKKQALQLFGMLPQEVAALQNNRKLTSVVSVAAPIDGFVLEQMAVAGQRLEAASPLYKIGALSPMWLEIQVPATEAARLQEGSPVTIKESKATGRVISIGKSLNAANQTLMIRAEITENAEKLYPEQHVVASVEITGSGAQQWRLPPAAIARHEGKAYVFVKTPAGFRAQEVKIESENAKDAIISGALAGNDLVAIDGVLAVKGSWLGLGGGE